MFESQAASPFARRPWVVLTSVAVHCIVLWLILRPPTPTIVRIQQVRAGNGGRSQIRLYWPGEDQSEAASSAKAAKNVREQTVQTKKLENPSKSLQIRLQKKELLLATKGDESSANSGKSRNAATAGSTYGTSYYDKLTGPEVRPALWIGGPNPAVAASEFAEGLEGSVIVEITIDDQGNVIATQLLQGLSSAVDAKVIEALQMAHFIPAKRNGTPIPSKQDVYYHFPR
jgi:TonB family protein